MQEETGSPSRAESGPGGRPEAALAVWTWRGGAASLHESRERLAAHARRESLVRSLIGAAVGALLWFLGHRTLAPIVWGVSAFVLLAGWLSPRGVYRAIDRALVAFARGVGIAISWILLPIFFFGFVLVFGLLARRGRKDRLERWFDDGSSSYWKERDDRQRDESFYRRQY